MMENKKKYFKNYTKKSLITFIQVEGNFQSLFDFCVHFVLMKKSLKVMLVQENWSRVKKIRPNYFFYMLLLGTLSGATKNSIRTI